MGRRKDRRGRFVADGEEDFAPQLRMEKYWNVMPVWFEFDSTDSSTPKVTSFPTGMEVQEAGDQDERVIGRKWVLKGACWQPESTGQVSGVSWETAVAIQVDLRLPGVTAIGRQTRGILGRSLMTPVHNGVPALEFAGLVHWPLPLDILTPMPIFSEDLEIVANTKVDLAPWQGLSGVMHLVYGWADARVRDVIAARQMGA